MTVLVLNCGSSSIKAAVFGEGDRAVARALVERIGTGPRVRIEGPSGREECAPDGWGAHERGCERAAWAGRLGARCL